MSDENTKLKVIAAEVDPSVKEAFERWWRAHNYRTESEALRDFVRDKVEEQKRQEIGAGK